MIVLDAVLTCPCCGAEHRERLPEDACRIHYRCSACGAELTPRPGDCCVFCSYGDVACPPLQWEALHPDPG